MATIDDMHNQLSASWTADWGSLPDRILDVIEANFEEFDLPDEKKVEIWANIFQENGFTVRPLQGSYGLDIDRGQFEKDRFACLEEDSERVYWLEVDGFLVDPTGARSLDRYFPFWFWPSPVFDDLMWQEDWQPLD